MSKAAYAVTVGVVFEFMPVTSYEHVIKLAFFYLGWLHEQKEIHVLHTMQSTLISGLRKSGNLLLSEGDISARF